MKFERLIAQKFLSKESGSFSTSLIRIAVIGIALGVFVMVMAIGILRGFQKEIQKKVVGFGSHIVVRSYDTHNGLDAAPIENCRTVIGEINSHPNVSHVQFFAEKGGMVKTPDQIYGVMLKGVDPGFDTTFFASNLEEGRFVNMNSKEASNEIIISRTIAKKLSLGLGDKVRTYFWQDNSYRARAFSVVGIYNTDLVEFDEHYMIGDIRQVQKLNGWDTSMVQGYEILLTDFGQLNQSAEELYQILDMDLTLQTVVEMQPALFSWLDLLNSNIVLILIVMMVVCAVSITSALLIMIFEKTSMIGLLKTLGANNNSIRKIFLIKSTSVMLKGILIGNIVAFVLSLIQSQFHIVRLDAESYSMDFVPVDIRLHYYLLVSILTLVICLLALLVPSTYIASISPSKTLKVE